MTELRHDWPGLGEVGIVLWWRVRLKRDQKGWREGGKPSWQGKFITGISHSHQGSQGILHGFSQPHFIPATILWCRLSWQIETRSKSPSKLTLPLHYFSPLERRFPTDAHSPWTSYSHGNNLGMKCPVMHMTIIWQPLTLFWSQFNWEVQSWGQITILHATIIFLKRIE